jgi:molybdopterin synthase sulfur carrier subunit
MAAGEPSRGHEVTVSVRYYAGARDAAGTGEERITLTGPAPITVATLAGELAARHGGGLAQVLAVCSFIVDEVTATRGRAVDDGARVDVLPPFAGG